MRAVGETFDAAELLLAFGGRLHAMPQGFLGPGVGLGVGCIYEFPCDVSASASA